jgi:hypothetical protein
MRLINHNKYSGIVFLGSALRCDPTSTAHDRQRVDVVGDRYWERGCCTLAVVARTVAHVGLIDWGFLVAIACTNRVCIQAMSLASPHGKSTQVGEQKVRADRSRSLLEEK